MLRLKLSDRSMCLIRVYAPNPCTQYPEFLEETSDALRRVESNKSTIVFGNFSAHVVKDAGAWKVVISNLVMLTQMITEGSCNCCNNALCIINTFVRRKGMHKYICRRDLCANGHSLISA